MSDVYVLELIMSAAGSRTISVPAGKRWCTVINPSGYSINIYNGTSSNISDRLSTSSFGDITFLLPNYTAMINVVWSGGTGVDQATIMLSEVSLGINVSRIPPSGASSVVVAGDTVGLARQAQLPAALVGGYLGISVSGDAVGLAKAAQLPAALSAGGSLKTMLNEALAQLPASLSGGGYLQVALAASAASQAVTVAQLPASLSGGGYLQVALAASAVSQAVTAAQLPASLTGSGNLKSAVVEDTVGLVHTAGTITQYAVTLTLANTEYSQALPANTRKVQFAARTSVAIRWAWVTGKVGTPTDPYGTLGAGAVYFQDNVLLASNTLYLGSATAGTVVEIEAWT